MVVGLSPALGTFLAGGVLADSEYRHDLESDIEPFKGLLLGIFFNEYYILLKTDRLHNLYALKHLHILHVAQGSRVLCIPHLRTA